MNNYAVNFIVVLDEAGHIVFSQGFDPATQEIASLPQDLGRHLATGSPLLGKAAQTDAAGILMLASGPVLIDSNAVLTSNLRVRRAGRLIMGRSLDAGEAMRLGGMTHMPVDIERFDKNTDQEDFRLALRQISEQNPVVFRPYEDGSLGAYQALHDIYGKPVVILRVLLPRQIYKQGQTSSLQFLLLLLAAGLVFGAVTMALLERFVVSRVAHMSDDITQIGASGDLGARLTISGQDEIAFLGDAVNSMLQDLETVQVERHAERTRLAVMVEKMPAILWTSNTILEITSAMGAGLASVGLREPVGMTVLEFFRTQDPDYPPVAAHRKALAGESVAYDTVWKDRRFESHVQPLRDGEGKIQGVIGVALDITERDRLTDQLRQSQKMAGRGASWPEESRIDFNNLLMVVKGHAQLLLDRLPASSALRPNVQQMERAADRAATLTRQLLAFSRKQVLQAVRVLST